MATKGVGVRAEFVRTADRFTHRFLAIDGSDNPEWLLEAIEGDPNDGWPCSPVLQELHLEELPDSENQQVAMLVGKAVDGHWSLVVRPVEDGERVGFLIEAACRVKSQPSSMGSLYRLRTEAEPSASDAAVEFNSRSGAFRLESDCQLAAAGDQVELIAENAPQPKLPATVQWSYGVWVL